MKDRIKKFDDLIEIHLRLSEFTYEGLQTLFVDIGYIHDEQSEFDFVVAWFGEYRSKMKSRKDNDNTVFYRIED